MRSSSCDDFVGPTATPRHVNGACVGEPREASLSQICRKPCPKFTALGETCAQSREGIVKNPGPLARQGGHLCPPWLWGRTLPKTRSFREQYSRHLVDVKCITLHIVFYAFPARTKRVTLFGPPRFSIFRAGGGVGVRCHLSREPCANTLFAICSSALRRAPANESPLRSRPATQSSKVGPPFGL